VKLIGKRVSALSEQVDSGSSRRKSLESSFPLSIVGLSSFADRAPIVEVPKRTFTKANLTNHAAFEEDPLPVILCSLLNMLLVFLLPSFISDNLDSFFFLNSIDNAKKEATIPQ
jgi:hypothetical protein